MPLYEFVCRHCNAEVELLVRAEERPACPQCHQPNLQRQLSVIATPASGGKSEPAPAACSMPRCCGGGCQL